MAPDSNWLDVLFFGLIFGVGLLLGQIAVAMLIKLVLWLLSIEWIEPPSFIKRTDAES